MSPLPINLDMDAVRTFLTGLDAGGFSKASHQLRRSPSAISMQLRKLEAQVGQPLFRKAGRALALTEAGEMLVGYARRLLDINDGALEAIRRPRNEAPLRLGLPQDVAETWLPGVLARFEAEHPGTRIDVRVDRNAALMSDFERGEYDVVAVWNAGSAPGPSFVMPMAWIGPISPREGLQQPLGLALFNPPCIFRAAGTTALDAANIAWQVRFSSPSLSGLWAAVAAGLGVTVRTGHGLPSTLKVLSDCDWLPPLPALTLSVRCAQSGRDATAAGLKSVLLDAFSAELASSC
jgi:DNA-binding transcriptional LysR family regulator